MQHFGPREHFRTKGPGGGPAFQITEDGSVNDSMQILARCANKRAAVAMLKAAGYRKVFYGWKA